MKRIAIITGATGGLGTAFIRAINTLDSIDEIWAIGRNTGKLADLSNSYNKTAPICADLLKDGVEILSAKLADEKPDVRLLINNAGVGSFGLFETMDSQSVQNSCVLNCAIPSVLISRALPYMKEESAILNISSASAFQPLPYLAQYAAGKAYLKSLSQALSMELAGRRIKVCAVCPGWIDTPMLSQEKDGQQIKYTGMVSADYVVETALKDCKKGKYMSVVGAFSKWTKLISKALPTRIQMKWWMEATKRYL